MSDHTGFYVPMDEAANARPPWKPFWAVFWVAIIAFVGVIGLGADATTSNILIWAIRMAFMIAHPIAVLVWIYRRLRRKHLSRDILIEGIAALIFTTLLWLSLALNS
jgi:hypothetical protein